MAHAFLKTGADVTVLKTGADVTVKQRCTKVAFESRQLARRAARDWRNPGAPADHGTGKMIAYRCFCGAWHIGHLPERRKIVIPKALEE